jgi:carbamoyltransferase
MRVLGLSFSGHGTAACLVEDGRIVRAVNLERITGHKFSQVTLPGFSTNLWAIQAAFGRTEPSRIFDFYEVFPRLLEYVAGETEFARAGIDLVVKTPDNIVPIESDVGGTEYSRFLRYFAPARLHFDLEHHLCHAYQAFLCSPFEDAAVLTVDGTGERLPRLGHNSIGTTLNVVEDERITVLREVLFPSTLGGLYSTVTRHLGFRDEQEGNTMALAAFGTDRFLEYCPGSWTARADGGYELALRDDLRGLAFFDAMRSFVPERLPGDPLGQDHFDLAKGVQTVTEEVLLHVASVLQRRTGQKRLAIAGGVALNCVVNSRVLEETDFAELYVMPNAGDRGLAAGAALWGYHVLLGGKERHPPASDYLGRAYTEADAVRALERQRGIEWERSDDIGARSAALIASGRIIGWHQGGCEFGPRALGHRSILADPRIAASKERLDSEIKRREWFRPYAPSVLAERADEYFEMCGPSPYMLQAVRTRPEVRSRVPGIVHVDGSARVQTVEKETEPLYHHLISTFDRLTGVPLVLNTSFNGYGTPIVETPADALASLEPMNLDAVVVGNYVAWPAGRRPW